MIKTLFNDDWYWWKDDNPFELVAAVPAFAERICLPHDAMFREKQREESVNQGSTGFLDGGYYKYSKKFFVDQAWKGGKAELLFEGVYRHALVYINQSLVGEQAYGYSEFYIDAGDYLRYGEENEVMVCVKCGTKNSRWYSGAGIYRNVWLLHGPALHIQAGSLQIETKQIEPNQAWFGQTGPDQAEAKSPGAVGAQVEIRADLQNLSAAAEDALCRIRLLDPAGEIAADESYPIRIKAGQTISFRKKLYVPDAKLWDEAHPNLYTAEMVLSDAAGNTDQDRAVTGLRVLSVDAKHGLRVNGETVKLRGACVHHDLGLLGAEAYEDAEYFRMKRLKEAGFNAIRSAHNHSSQAMLNACDRLGLYVMDELTDVWNKPKSLADAAMDFERDWEKDVISLVTADYNHPSVVLYSTGNEIFEIATEKGIETSRRLGDLFHRLDPARFTTNGINGAFAAGDGLQQIVEDITGHKPGAGDVNVFMMAMAMHMPKITRHPIVGGILEKLESTMDVLGYNYMTARYLMDAEKYPNRVMVGSETCPKQIAENWAAISACPAAIGDFTWTGWDYMGEVPAVFPNLFNTGGDISVTGTRRAASYYREIVFGLKKGPVIAVQNPDAFGCDRNFGPGKFTDCELNYTWPGKEGKPVMVEIYAGGDSVELLQNGKSLGKKPCGVGNSFFVQYDTVYEPGLLEAVVYEKGKEISRGKLETTGEVTDLSLKEEKGEALSFISIELQDEKGRRVFGDEELSIELSGGELLAFGSEKSLHDRGFTRPVCKAADGEALAVIRRMEGKELKITVSCGKTQGTVLCV